MSQVGKIPKATGYTSYDTERLHEEGTKESVRRSAFEIDKGRIIHCNAFRRLQGKTEVFGAGERDFYRTRLTHSLEVAQLGRGIANEAATHSCKPDLDLVEAICLAHDIGHPAFGHHGENVIHYDMFAAGGFGANPQNLRIVAALEPKLAEGEGKLCGLNLTRATLDGLTKYPSLFDYNECFDFEKFKPKGPTFVYVEDEVLLKWIKKGALQPELKPIEGQIADWADTVAYAVNDFEDAYRARILDLLEMQNRAAAISKRAQKGIAEEGYLNVPSITSAPAIRKYVQSELINKLLKPSDYRNRKVNLKKWTSATIKELIGPCTIENADKHEKSIRYRYTLKITDASMARAQVLKAAMRILVFENPRVKTLEFKGGEVLSKLMKVFINDPNLLPLDYRELVEKNAAPLERLVADFVSGMTDRYAYDYYCRLFDPNAGSIYEDV